MVNQPSPLGSLLIITLIKGRAVINHGFGVVLLGVKVGKSVKSYELGIRCMSVCGS